MLLVILTILIILISFILYKHQINLKIYKNIPGPKPRWPIIGNALLLLKEKVRINIAMLKVFSELAKKYQNEGLFCLFLGTKPIIFLFGADTVETLLTSDNYNKAPEYRFLRPILLNGIGTQSGAKWQETRRMITPAFHLKNLQKFADIFNNVSRELVNEIKLKFNNEFIDHVFDMMSEFTLKNICETAMGYKLQSDKESDLKYIEGIQFMKKSIMARFFNPLYSSDFVYNRTKPGRELPIHCANCYALVERVIRERKQLFKDGNLDQLLENKKIKLSFLDLFFKIQMETNALTDIDIRNEVQTIMFSGFDSASTTLAWACLVLGNHPDIQRKLRDDVNSFKSNENDDFTIEDFNEMKYMDAFTKETLRLYGTPPIIGRQLTSDLKMKDYVIPEGAVVYIYSYGLHRDSRVYPSPEVFDPERFMSEEKRSPFAFIPFSGGPRNCVGLKYAVLLIKVLLAHIIQNFEIVSSPKENEMVHSANFTLNPANDVQVKFIPIAK